ncbi:uncharacterized protein KY384_004153 [Bacidia gigantensis]|uniref:uncharacterized protein n=1 Tax=Bacidia gigantensis TaxID=2732470 RepID=UPI001D05421B|nr:uncharacterized protein KY384_004153 [Bacidia gigantensis]KAG8530796.1 hypothetical protein KY384_004153 [Bacidia gigantensis]
MVARTDGIGQFVVEGNFELDPAITTGENDKLMSQGQFEADKAIHAVSPSFGPKPHAWGRYREAEIPTYFLLADFREIGQQPPDAIRFTSQLAEFHKRSVSPTGKFGFHITTCHGKAAQLTNLWDESWESLFRKQLAHTWEADKQKHPDWQDFEFYKKLILDKCVGRLLRPLQSQGRNIKPCLVHGNIWDQNTATDMETGEPFVFDGSAFFAHNEYELGNWRSPRHRLGSKTYIRNYKRAFPASEPEDEWDLRNLLYSLRFNTCAATLIPGSNYREQYVRHSLQGLVSLLMREASSVFEDCVELCSKLCPDDVAAFKSRSHGDDADSAEEELEELEEEEEEADGGHNNISEEDEENEDMGGYGDVSD